MSSATSILNAVVKAAEAVNTEAESENRIEYKDGLPYCKICGEPKFYKAIMLGVEKTLPCACSCEMEKYVDDENAAAQAQKDFEIKSMRSLGIQDKSLQDCRFGQIETNKAVETCKRYAARWDEMNENGIGLLLWGNVGGGKTTAAACIANELIDKGVPVLMTSFPRILNTQTDFDKSELFNQIRKYPLVIIDDLGVERQSAYAKELVYMIIDERYKSGKPLIVTTNYTYKDIKRFSTDTENYDNARMYDRIVGMCVPVMFERKTRREQESKDKMLKARKILELG